MAIQETVQQDSYTDTIGRMRALEGKYNLLRDRMLIINNNMIEQYKKNIAETRTINEDIKEIKIDIFKIKETIKHLVEVVKPGDAVFLLGAGDIGELPFKIAKTLEEINAKVQ